MMEFSDEVRRLAAEKSLSLRELARRSHYHVSHLSNVLNGHKRLTPQMAADLDKTLGADGKLAALAPVTPPKDRPGDFHGIADPDFGPIRIPDAEWRTPESIRALRNYDFRTIFHLAYRHGISPAHIAHAARLTEDLVKAVMNGHAVITESGPVSHIADSFNIPPSARIALCHAPAKKILRGMPAATPVHPSRNPEQPEGDAAPWHPPGIDIDSALTPGDGNDHPARGSDNNFAAPSLSQPAIYADAGDLERREFLMGLATSAGLAALTARESIRHGLARSLSEERGTADVDEWHEIALEYGDNYWTTAPAVLLESLMADIAGLQAALHRCASSADAQRELRSAGALLAAFTAQTIANLGSTREALRWWRTARRSADESGDPYTALWVRSREIVRAGYEHRPTTTIMRLVEEAEHSLGKAGQAPAHPLPQLLSGKAQTLALMGRRAEAETTLGELHECFEALSASSVNYGGAQFPWGKEKLHFTNSFVYSHLGDFERAEQAQRAALPFYSSQDLRSPAQLELHRALCLVHIGDITEGIRHAREVISGLPNEHRIVIVDLGWDILNTVPKPDQQRTDVMEYRNWLNASSASQPNRVVSS